MKSLTIGQKIAFGFATLIVLATGLGGLAVYNMAAVEKTARQLSEEFVPESRIAANLEQAVNRTMLAARTYGLTGDAQYLQTAQKEIQEVQNYFQEAEKLAQEHPGLVKLKEHLSTLAPSLKQFNDAVASTAEKTDAIRAGRAQLDKNAASFTKNIEELLARQSERLGEEIKDFSEVKKLSERTLKIKLLNDIQTHCNSARILVFKAQALREPKMMDDAEKIFAAMDQTFASVAPLVKVPADVAELEALKKSAHAYSAAVEELRKGLLALNEVNNSRAEVGTRVTDLSGEVASAGMQRTVSAAKASREKLSSASAIVKVGLFVAFLAGIAIALAIIRGTTRVLTAVARTLEDGSTQVAAAASQVAGASQSLAEGASEQAASLEETGASLEEMASMTRKNAEDAEAAKTLANQTRAAADTGANEMRDMSSAMNAIKASSDNIAKIIKTIDEIAFRTNILALNAAVEAARAGDAGMGFAVVADEVRNLAQRSALAAKETAQKIEDSIRKSDQGVQISARVAQSLTEMVEKARQVDELVGAIAVASNEQSQGIQQVNTAVTQMDKVTQSNAANAEESASASEELNAQAETLKEAVDDLMKLVGGTSLRSAKPRQPANAPRETKANKSAAAPEPKAARRNIAPKGMSFASGGTEADLSLEESFKNF